MDDEVRGNLSTLLMAVAMVAGVLMTVAGLGAFVALLVTLWDALAWLTKSDWRTTGFDAFYIGVALAFLAAALGTMIIGPIMRWMDKTDSR